MNQIQPSSTAFELARQVLRIEGNAVQALIERVDASFLQALSFILNSHARIIVSGGLIGAPSMHDQFQARAI